MNRASVDEATLDWRIGQVRVRGGLTAMGKMMTENDDASLTRLTDGLPPGALTSVTAAGRFWLEGAVPAGRMLRTTGNPLAYAVLSMME